MKNKLKTEIEIILLRWRFKYNGLCAYEEFGCDLDEKSVIPEDLIDEIIQKVKEITLKNIKNKK